VNEFEYVMALMAIILGLGITHLLAGFGKIIYRLTGHGTPLRFNWVHFLWVVNTFMWMVFYWWYSFSRVGREEWALATYLLMLPFPVFVYLQCVVLYPHRLDEVTDLGAYFMATRRWFFGLMLLITLADFAEGGLFAGTDPAAAAYLDSTGWSLLLAVAYTIFAALVGIASSNARVHIGLAAVSIMLGIWQQFDDHPVLGALSF
jgi:hypothetical protein